MNQPPVGTVTFLFTDIEGSTKLWQQHPETMDEALRRHHALLNASIAAHGGYIFQIIGDAFCAAFHTALDGLQAALAAQYALHEASWGETGPLKVRMALHTGAVEIQPGEKTSGEYVSGITLSRSARLLSAGHGGQVLLSQATFDLLAYELPKTVRLIDLGEHRLKDLGHPEHIYQLAAINLEEHFPPLKTLDSLPNNLPIQLSKFIGREKEIAQVKGKLGEHRLVTLTGSGGVGKTRLAIQVGHEALSLFPDGVWLIELAPLAYPDLVPQALITTFGLPEDAKRTPLAVLADYLHEKTALLILDNCEHVIDACARLAEHLLMQCPDLRILASSRESLGIEGEVALRVPSLSLPPAETSGVEALAQSEAVQLFLDRAANSLPGFSLTEANAGAIVEVCRRLDGIALAIELAASRVRLLQVEQIAMRLDDAFRLLTGGSRAALPRQQTLRATIDWSYNLLSDPERRLLRQLAVFAGGGRLEAVELICSGNGLEEFEVLDVLAQLVDKSLVMAERRQGEEPRYSLLETIRQYAREKLHESQESEAVREQHARWYGKLAETAEPKTHGHGQIESLGRLEQEHDNFRAALDWSLHNGVELGMQIASALTWFWVLRGHAVEGYQQMEALLAAGPSAPSLLRARALTWAAWLAGFAHHEEQCTALANASVAMSREVGYLEGQAFSNITIANELYHHGDYEQALPLAEAGLALFRKTGIQWGIRHALGIVGYITQAKGNYEQAKALFQESLAISRDIGDMDGMSWSFHLLGNLATTQGNYEKAMVFYQDSLPIAQEVRNKSLISWIYAYMGNAAILSGQYTKGRTLLEECIPLMRELGDFPYLAIVLTRLGRLASLEGEYDQATKYFLEGLQLARKSDGREAVAWSIAGLAELASLRDQPRKAARLLAAAQALPGFYNFLWLYGGSSEQDQILDTIRLKLDQATILVEQEAGRQMSLEDAVAYALDEDAK